MRSTSSYIADRKTKVANFQLEIAAEHYVIRLEITMRHLHGVAPVQAVESLAKELTGNAFVERVGIVQ